MHAWSRWAPIAILICLSGLSPSRLAAQHSAAAMFDRDIAPLLAHRCLDCHNENDKKGGLNLVTAAGARAGGDSGAVISEGQVEKSILWQRIADEEMPPGKPLSSAEKELIRSWIAVGAVWETSPIDRFGVTSETRAGLDWWAFEPLSQSPLPAVEHADWPRQPLDQLVLARLEAKAWRPRPRPTAAA